MSEIIHELKVGRESSELLRGFYNFLFLKRRVRSPEIDSEVLGVNCARLAFS